MNDTQAATEYNAVPHDPAMAAADPAMFASVSRDENVILSAHLTSGWHKQAAVYPGLSEPWRETSAVLDDLTGAWWANRRAERGEPEAPEAGTVTPGDAWDAFVSAQQAADEAVRECGGSPGDGTPEGGHAASLLDSADLAWSQFEATALAEPEAGS